MKQADLIGRVAQVVDAAPNDTATSWIVHKLVDEFSREERTRTRHSIGEVFLLCAFEHITDTVRGYLRTLELPRTVANPQGDLFPGFKHLQAKYPIERDGESRIVHLDQATPSEIRVKAKEYRLMGAGCFAHADELDRYADLREAGRVS